MMFLRNVFDVVSEQTAILETVNQKEDFETVLVRERGRVLLRTKSWFRKKEGSMFRFLQSNQQVAMLLSVE